VFVVTFLVNLHTRIPSGTYRTRECVLMQDEWKS